MRRVTAVTLFVFLSLAGLVGGKAFAQDPAEVAPEIFTVLFENDQVRVAEVRFAPGAKIGTHSHPDHFVYPLADGQLKLSYADGTSKDMVAKAGEVLWGGAETHVSENVGPAEFHGLVVELKAKASDV